MTEDFAALEARVAELENQMRHILPHKIDAVGYGLSQPHEDMRAFRQEMAAFGEQTAATLDRLDDRQSEMVTTLAQQGYSLNEHGELLREIVRRLPPASEG